MNQTIKLLSEGMTQRIEFFFKNMTLRIELCVNKIILKNFDFFFNIWLSELNLSFLLTMNPRIDFFEHMTQRIELFDFDSINLNFFCKIWLKELNLFLKLTQWIDLVF